MAHWSIPFDKLAKKVGADIEIVVKAAALTVFSDVVIRSPEDTGRFRQNWNLAYTVMNETITDETSHGFQGKIDAIRRELLTMPIGGVFWLTNSLPYALVLEYGLYPNPPKRGTYVKGEGWVIKSIGGYSKQAPHGMVRIAARNFAENVDRAVNGRRKR